MSPPQTALTTPTSQPPAVTASSDAHTRTQASPPPSTPTRLASAPAHAHDCTTRPSSPLSLPFSRMST
ncbi:hypothetical protein M422DRAFT_32980, partial [Sphaerobolus stellatus SS14]